MGVRFPLVAHCHIRIPMAHHPNHKRYFQIFILRLVGNYLILVSLFFIIKTFYDPVLSEVRYFVDTSIIRKEYVVVSDKYQPIPVNKRVVATKSQLASFFNIPQVEPMSPVDPDFSIIIPKIAANARVIDNVNPADESEYLDKLQFGVAHAAGTYLPGQNGHIFLFAHSTDYVWNISTYNAVFYLLYKLDDGDEVNIFHQGRRYVYTVTGKKVVEPTDVQYLTNKTESEFLTLQTCWPPGTTLKRLLVFAKPKVE